MNYCTGTVDIARGAPSGARSENELRKVLCGDAFMANGNGFIDASRKTGLGVDADESALT